MREQVAFGAAGFRASVSLRSPPPGMTIAGGVGGRSAAQLGQKPCSATQASVTDRAVWVGPLKTTVGSAKPSSHQ